MIRPASVLVLLFAGLLAACSGPRPLPAPSAKRMLTAPATAADHRPTAGYPLDLPEELFDHPEEDALFAAEGEVALAPNERVLAIARQFVGVPYRKGGASPAGFDCSGLVYYAFREAGIPVPRTSASQHRAARTVALDDLRSGDLLFFKIRPQSVSHVGIYMENNIFLHAPSAGKNVTYSRLDEPYWKKRLIGAGRFADH